jgi:spore maturation protein SpmA
MLNYVWIGLLALGMIAAVTVDVRESATGKYANGSEIPARLLFEEPVEKRSGKTREALVEVSPSAFKKTYGEAVSDTIRFPAKITFTEDEKTAALYFVVSDSTPALWREMAAVGGEEDDLTGKAVVRLNEDGTRASATLTLEKISFVKLKNVTSAAIDYATTAVEIALGLIGIMAMWLGVMKIAEEAGAIRFIANLLKPIMKRLFPEVPPDHPAMGSMIMNLSATFLGLGNAATPFGIKAMEDLQTLNDKKDTATNAMCTFLVMNTASFALMPATAIAVRAAAGSSQPAIIIGTTMFGSFTATVVGITMAKFLENFPPKWDELGAKIKRGWRVWATLAGVGLAVAALAAFGMLSAVGAALSFLNPESLEGVIKIISIVAIPLVILTFVMLGMIRKVKVYETFVEGAKEGFDVAVTIIPYLAAILVAIGVFRAGGAMEWLVYILKPITDFIGMPAEALPMALMRPLSGSGSLGIMAEIIATHGPDSYLGILVSTFFGSTETTFYVLAVYFGAVNIKNSRHALPAGLIADVSGILAAIFIVNLIYG